MVDNLAEKRSFTCYDNAFSFLTKKEGFISLGGEFFSLRIITVTNQLGRRVDKVVIEHEAKEGSFEYVLGAPDANKPGLVIERFDPRKICQSLSGRIYEISLGEREYQDYYDPVTNADLRRFLALGEIDIYKRERETEGWKVAENIRELIGD